MNTISELGFSKNYNRSGEITKITREREIKITAMDLIDVGIVGIFRQKNHADLDICGANLASVGNKPYS